MYGWRFTSQPLADHIGVSQLLIITTSNSPPWVDTSAVILARASFSGSDTKSRLTPGCSCSKRGDRLMASFICDLETIATVTVLPEAPPEKSCFAPTLQPERASAAPPVVPARKALRLRGLAGVRAAPDPAARRVIVASRRPGHCVVPGSHQCSSERLALIATTLITNTLIQLLGKVKKNCEHEAHPLK